MLARIATHNSHRQSHLHHKSLLGVDVFNRTHDMCGEIRGGTQLGYDAACSLVYSSRSCPLYYAGLPCAGNSLERGSVGSRGGESKQISRGGEIPRVSVEVAALNVCVQASPAWGRREGPARRRAGAAHRYAKPSCSLAGTCRARCTCEGYMPTTEKKRTMHLHPKHLHLSAR